MQLTTNKDKNNINEFVKELKQITKDKKILFACIGTDRSTGDALGCLVGTHLEELGYNVIGTINEPLHATNLAERMAGEKQKGYDLIIGIDACLGKMTSVGNIYLEDRPLKPGKGVGKDLPEVGDYNIKGVVNVSGYMEFMVLQNTRLSVVMQMANVIVEAVKLGMPIEIHNEVEIRENNLRKLYNKVIGLFPKKSMRLAS